MAIAVCGLEALFGDGSSMFDKTNDFVVSLKRCLEDAEVVDPDMDIRLELSAVRCVICSGSSLSNNASFNNVSVNNASI